MAFFNKVRLPFYVTRPQFPSERNIFPLADGSTKTQSIIIKKTYDGETDYLTELLHQRLVIALSHDTVNIESDKYLGGVSLDAEYQIDWTVFLDYPVAKGGFKIRVTPFSATNSNCQTCDDAAQISLVDDTFPSDVDEGAIETINVFTNDSISCYPFVASITTFNPTYVDSASIDANGLVTIQMKTPLPINSNVNLLTYRVTCPNGGYDEADVFADVNGSIVVCGEPYDIVGNADEDSIPLSWTPPATPPGDGYQWEIYDTSNLGTPVQTGTTATPNVTITGLDPATHYYFYVKSVCSPGNESGFVLAGFTTASPPGSGSCGFYRVWWNDGTGDTTVGNNVTYLACDGTYHTVFVFNNKSRLVCAAQLSIGNPTDVVGATLVEYIGTC